MAGINLNQNLSQQQTLSPQMRRSLEVLQANSLELGQIISQAIALNPVIEVTTNDEVLPDDTPLEAEHDHETISELEDDYRDSHITEHANRGPSQETIDYLYNSIVAPKTLQQHLTEQLQNESISEEIRSAADEIIAHVNDRGFLDQPVDDIGITSTHSLIHLEKALIKVQGLEPPGVGASDLQESLLIQLYKKNRTGSLEYKITEHHMQDLALKRYPLIAKSLNTTVLKVDLAAQAISTLSPDPGAAFDPSANPYIQPDIIIYKSKDGEWTSNLTNANLPTISISNDYKDLMVSTTDTKTRNYLRDHISDGKIIIKALSQRQTTLAKMAQQIIKNQRPYLELGSSHIKPLTMNKIAEVIEVHPTTISRAVAGKYILTPHGVTELRSFFCSGYESSDGSQISNFGIKDIIQKLIDQEPSNKPLSDSAIEKILKTQGYKVARRTVAKYRDQLGILPSQLRKKFS